MTETVWKSLAKFQRQGSNLEFPFSFESEPSHSEVCATWWHSYIPLPKFLAAKKAIINLKNEDDECFKWAITPALNPVEKNSERIAKKTSRKIRGPQLE